MNPYAETFAHPIRRLEEPPGEAVLIIGFGEPLDVIEPSGRRRTLRAFAVPLGLEPTVTEQRGEQRGIEVRLNPLLARRVLGVPMDELSPHGTELEDVLGREADELVDRVAEADGWGARLALVREMIGRRGAAAPPPRRDLEWAWERLHDPAARVEDVARETGWSRRHLATLFREHVGVSPKAVARILRFRRVADRLRAGDTLPLGELALEAGYYDQAHLGRDFRDLAGCTPGEFSHSYKTSAPALHTLPA